MIHFCVFQELAVKNESGLSENPLKILWLEGQPEVIAPTSQPGQFMSQVPVLPENAFFFPSLSHKACRPYVTKSSHVHSFQHK